MAVEENRNSVARKPVSYKDFDADDDDVPLSKRLSQQTSKFRRCSSNCVDSVKKGHTTLPVKKRSLDNNNPLHISIKRAKVSPYDNNDNGDSPLSWRTKRLAISADKLFSIQECQRKRKEEEQRLHSRKRNIEECSKELVAKRVQLSSMEGLIEVRKQEHKRKEIDLRRFNDKIDKDRVEKDRELKILSQNMAECTKELKAKEKEIDAMKKVISGQAKELESERKMLFRVISIRKTDQHAQMKDFELNKKQFEGQVKQLESKEKQCEIQVKELESKEKHFEERVKELESKVKQLEDQVREFVSKEEEFKGQIKELKSKQKHLESRVKKHKSKKKQFEGRAKELESKQEVLESQTKDLESQKKHFESQVEELKSKEKQFEGRLKMLESKVKQLEGRLKEFETKEQEFEGRVKEIRSKNIYFKSGVKELELKEKLFEGLESKSNKCNGERKDLELKEKQYEALIQSFEEEKESDNQLSTTIDGSSQLLPSNQKDELEFLGNDILVDLLASSDPSKVILDIIQNPIIPHCRNGDSAVIIDRNHILLLEQLMRISPAVKPYVREEAFKLALDLKANMSENTENSLVILGFLLLVSIYGLVSYFDEDEVFKLFGFVAHHKIAIKLFGTMGFADRISDFVQNLISKQQYIEAVTFICAYNLVDKFQLVDLL